VTQPAPPTAQQRADATARATELATTAAVVAMVLAVLAAILAPVFLARRARRNRAAVWATQVAAAAALRRWRPRVSAMLTQAASRPPSAAQDPVVRHAVATVDAAVATAIHDVVEQLGRPLETDADEEALQAAVDAVGRTAQRFTARVTNRATAIHTIALAERDNAELVWVAERDACLHCLSYSGQTAKPGGTFSPLAGFDPHPLPWSAHGVDGPPLHDHCRCRLWPATAMNAAAAAREAERSVARGWSAYASVPERLRATARLLSAPSSRLPKSVVERAERDLRRGAFSTRHRARMPHLGH